MPLSDQQRENEFRKAARERASDSESVRQRSPMGVHAQLRSGIRRGIVGAHDRLDEESLVRTYSTSRNSVRAALALLAEEGIVSRIAHHGTQVVEAIDDIRIDNGIGWSPHETGRHVTTEDRDLLLPTTPLIRDLLQTTCETVRVHQLVDLRDDVPFFVHINYAVDTGVPRRPMTTEPPYEDFEVLFERAYGAPLARIDCSVQAVSSDERSARLLQVATGTTLLLKERLLWDATGTPREFSHTYYIAKRTALTTVTWAPGYGPDATDDPFGKEVISERTPFADPSSSREQFSAA